MTKDRKEYYKQYYEAHKEEKKRYYEEYDKVHSKEIKQYQKKYYDTHKDERKQYNKEYRDTHRDKFKQYYDTHRDELKQYNKEYRKNNIDNPEGYTIYCYINKLNGKRYIGKTKQILKFRKCAGYRNNKELNYILQKYGWDLFDTEIFLSGLTKEEATYFEKKFIKMFNTTDKDYGYNKQIG